MKKITGYYNDTYVNVVDEALRKINNAYDFATGKSKYAGDDGNKINSSDDYKTLFKYTYAQIYAYKIRSYGTDINVTNADTINKVWNVKLGLYVKLTKGANEEKEKYKKYEKVLTRTDLYVDLNDSYETKMGYDSDKLYLYYQVFGYNAGNMNSSSAGAYSGAIQKEQETKFINKLKKEVGGEETLVDFGKEYYEQHANDFSDKYSQAGYENDIAAELEEKKIDKDKDEIFSMPKNKTAVATNASSEFIEDADAFLNDENATNYLKTENLQSFSNSLYGNLLGVGIVIAILVGAILGVKFMLASVAQKAEIKKLLIPYLVGCVVVFGAFGIWKLVVTILAGI